MIDACGVAEQLWARNATRLTVNSSVQTKRTWRSGDTLTSDNKSCFVLSGGSPLVLDIHTNDRRLSEEID